MIFPIETYAPFLKQLKKIYADMDRAYEKAAVHYGFKCNGCEDNCCLTRFHHHTFLEYYYIYEGYMNLEPEVQEQVKKLGAEVCRKTAEADRENKTVRIMCPLNADGLCRIYEHRPMICRLHGIAHELRRPGQNPSYGPGCGDFTKQTEGMDYFPFDRTPFYINMARLENELKLAAGITKKIKMTIAEMIDTF